ncbi:hypothetical protein [Sphingomonas elodea]|uniref:hypothetical protein n=1 Tax=Sphingomonas elodea TaxID=179878 RepID=UPI000263067C|nr:hypothetical protein [Sphingomonas elodea]
MRDSEQPRRSPALRIAWAFAAGLAFCLGAYLLIDYARPDGLISISFLILLPALVTAFIATVSDPSGERPRHFYTWQVPTRLLGAVIVASILFLREGTICIVMLAPIWLLSGAAGGALAHRFFATPPSDGEGLMRSSALLIVPVLAMQIEPLLPVPTEQLAVTRSVVVAADPATIWPLAQGVGEIAPGEGRWNVSQSLIRLPRPESARLIGTGVGAIREVRWQQRLNFQEVITGWQPARRIWWRFHFAGKDLARWGLQDRHLLPDGPAYRISEGGYTLQPLSKGHTRLTLTTRYLVRTPVNWYARLWGELFIGDVSNNVLAVIAARAEKAQGLAPPARASMSPPPVS